MIENKTPGLSEVSFPPLSEEFISEFRVMPYQVRAVQESPGMNFENFWNDYVNYEIPSPRVHSLDINSLKLRRVLNRADKAGTHPVLIGVSIGFFWKVGGEEWNLTI
jgi:hypothetical protein